MRFLFGQVLVFMASSVVSLTCTKSFHGNNEEFISIFKLLLMKFASLFILILFVLSCSSAIEYPEGGYEYVKDYKDEDTNFYFLPVRDSFSREDSFYVWWEGKNFYEYAGEPNLSIKPLNEETFRLTYSEALGATTFIILKKNEIIIKELIPDSYTHNDELLNDEQKKHLEILEWNYPLDDKNHSAKKRRLFDSLTELTPALLDPQYYYFLKKKCIVIDSTKARHITKIILINDDQYRSVITSLNKSGYWQLPVHFPCIEPPNDGFGYILEANTKRKYNIVISGCCENQITDSFAKACDELVKLAGLGNDFSLYWNGKTDTAHQIYLDSIQVQDIQMEQPDTNAKVKSKR